MLAIIWLEIVTKSYDDLCNKISRSSLPLETDSVDIIFQHTLRYGPLHFFNKKVLELWYFTLISVQDLQSFMFSGL